MANVIKHKRGSGSDPVASDLVVGEVAIRTDVGKLFTKMDNGSVAEIAGGGSDIAINTLSSSSATGGGSATFNGSAYRFTLSAPPSVSAQQLLVSINGVIQKPVAGTGQPSEGFSVDGTDIILGDAPATGSDFFILTFKSLGVSEPADNSVTSAKIVDGAIVNADINASAAIAGTKISPDFGSQNITTTGSLTGNGLVINSTFPSIQLNDTNNDSDFSLINGNGFFRIFDDTASASRFSIASDGTATFGKNLDCLEGVDVTGAITGTGDLTIDTNTLHVDSSNNRVGIGTTSPDTELHVKGVGSILKLETTATTGSNYISFDDADEEKAFVGLGSSGDDSFSVWLRKSSNLRFATNNTERMRIDDQGRVGIGTTSPSSLLHLSATNPVFQLTGTSAGNCVLQTDGADLTLNVDSGNLKSSSALAFRVDNSEKTRIDSSGNVGIGTTSPGHKLHLKGTDTAYSNSVAVGPILELEDTVGRKSQFIAPGAVGEAGAGTPTNHDFTLFTNNTERIRIKNTGNVGIGLSDPDQELEVAGVVAANDLKIGRLGDRFPIIQRHTASSGSQSMTITAGAGLSTFTGSEPTINDATKGAAIKIGAGNPTSDVFGGGIRYIANGSTSPNNPGTGNQHVFYTRSAANTLIERMRIKHDGDIFLGSSSVAANHGTSNSSRGLVYDSDGGIGNHPFVSIQHGSRSSGNPAHIKFQTAGNEEGSIRQSNLGFEISYNNTSDYRLKENVVDISDGITRLKTLKPRRYNWIADETNTTTDGFLAHEVMTAVPQAVTGTKDEVDENDKPVYQQIDQSKLVPLLVAALQEAIGRIEVLEAK